MPRDHARLNLAIWSDPDFRALPPAAQHLYMVLWTSPDLSYCGVHDWRPGRLAARSQGFTGEHIRTVAACLIARHFLVADEDSEEILIRSWARFDGLMKQPRMAVSYVNAYAAVASQVLRQVLAHETEKIHRESPDLACWSDPRVSELLSHPSVSAKDLPTPDDPFGPDVTPDLDLGLPLGLPQTQGKVYPSVYTPPTPAPTPATKPLVVKGGVGGTDSTATGTGRKRPAKPLPEDWTPNDKHAALATERGVDLQHEAIQFRNHAEANDRRQVDWDAAFRQWLGNARPGQQPRQLPERRLIEEPPPGLSPAQYAEWYATRQEQRRRA